jgi:FkbM family methyltransferase
MKYSKILKSFCKQVLINSKRADLPIYKLYEQHLDEYVTLAILDSVKADTQSRKHYSSFDFLLSTFQLARDSQSQIFQDLWVLWMTGKKTNGFFVEFGAVDGISFSNTYLLENKFGWTGILAEPNPDMWDQLSKNRTCTKVNKCVFSESGKSLHFQITERPELSTIFNSPTTFSDGHTDKRNSSKSRLVSVQTISLNELLERNNAPEYIDYLSVDTEGSEYDILSALDFERWNISLITVEHNRTLQEAALDTLLGRNGYTRVFKGLSLFDAWYIKKGAFNTFQVDDRSEWA